jgi:hypothetical protein
MYTMSPSENSRSERFLLACLCILCIALVRCCLISISALARSINHSSRLPPAAIGGSIPKRRGARPYNAQKESYPEKSGNKNYTIILQLVATSSTSLDKNEQSNEDMSPSTDSHVWFSHPFVGGRMYSISTQCHPI